MSAVPLLVGDVERFRARCWGRRPAVHHSADPEWVRDLLPLRTVDDLLADPSTRPPYVEVYEDSHAVRERSFTTSGRKRSVVVHDSVDVDSVADRFSRGATLVLNHPEDHLPQLARLCRDFQDEFTAPTVSLAFLTPPGRRGMGLHLDAFEGFIVQTHGSKRWQVYEQEPRLTKHPRGMRDEEVGAPVLEVTLRPGDCLYLPWGTPHRAVSEDGGVSCHLTLTCLPRSWDQFVAQLIAGCIPAEADDVLCPGTDAGSAATLARLLAETVAAARQRDAGAELARYLDGQRSRVPEGAGFLSARAGADTVGPDSEVGPGLPPDRIDCSVRADGRVAVRSTGRREVLLPAAAAPALPLLFGDGPVLVRDVAAAVGARLPADRLLAVVRVLVGERFLLHHPEGSPT